MYKIITSFCSLLLLSLLAHQASADVRDPTTPLGHIAANADGEKTQFTLNSVLVSPRRKLAIINGETLREGQTIPGTANVWVQKISTQSVVLQQADQTWVLRLSPSILKKH
ncbi:MAG TPA: hypothetical protein VLC79_01515 [Cellvibrio sp.]|nr:hypothetical protein [Cellvibrio sp.]